VVYNTLCTGACAHSSVCVRVMYIKQVGELLNENETNDRKNAGLVQDQNSGEFLVEIQMIEIDRTKGTEEHREKVDDQDQ